MGYYTSYSGELTISPPLSKPEYLRLHQVIACGNSEEILNHARADVFDASVPALTSDDRKYRDVARTVSSPTYAMYNMLLLPGKIQGRGEEHSGRCDRELLQILAEWLATNGHGLTGSMEWEGSEGEDRGTIYAKPVHNVNCVEWIQDEIGNPGPSWTHAPEGNSNSCPDREENAYRLQAETFQAILEEFVQDVQAANPKKVAKEWPDLRVTFNKAKKALGLP